MAATLDAIKLTMLSSAGTLAVITHGSLWWLVPAVGYGATVLYDNTTPEGERPALLRAGAGRVAWEGAKGAPALLRGAVAQLSGARPAAPSPEMTQLAHDLVADDNGDGAATGATVRLKAPTPKAKTDPALERGRAILAAPLYDSNPDNARGPTIFAAKPRHGKTQAQIACLVEDAANGAETVWMSTHATLYHPTDQPVDLRSLGDRLELVTRGTEIRDRLRHYVDDEMEERLQRYTRGEEVGHPIALHIGEWPALKDQFGEEVCAPMRRLLREAPKTQIIVSLDAQDAQVQTLGLGSGLRNVFWTKVIGNVDEYSWKGLTDEPYRKMPARSWFVPGRGVVAFPQAIERAAELTRPVAADVVRRDAAPDDLLASLLALPSEVRKAVPDIAPERAARLAALYVPAHQDAMGTDQVSPVPTSPMQDRGTGGQGDSKAGTLILPGDSTLNLYLSAAAQATAPTQTTPHKGATTRRKRPLAPPAVPVEDRSADELYAAYRAAGTANRPYRETYRELGGSKTETLKAWQEGKAGRK